MALARLQGMGRRAGFAVIMTDHAFDKVRAIDMTLAEFEVLYGGG